MGLKTAQRTVVRPSRARVAVPAPLELHYSPTSTELGSTRKERKTENCLHDQKLPGKTILSLSSQPTLGPDTQEFETLEIKLLLKTLVALI